MQVGQAIDLWKLQRCRGSALELRRVFAARPKCCRRAEVLPGSLHGECGGRFWFVDWQDRRAELRDLQRQLNDELNAWDPLGVADFVADEYECMAGPLLRMLIEGADADQLGVHLRGVLEGHFGLSRSPDDVDVAADRLIAWWAGASVAAEP
jgi:hypothetical protein